MKKNKIWKRSTMLKYDIMENQNMYDLLSENLTRIKNKYFSNIFDVYVFGRVYLLS